VGDIDPLDIKYLWEIKERFYAKILMGDKDELS